MSALSFHHSDLGPGRRCCAPEMPGAESCCAHTDPLPWNKVLAEPLHRLKTWAQESELPSGDPDPALDTATGSLRKSRMSHLRYLLLLLVDVLWGEISTEVQNFPWEEKREPTSSRTSALHHPAHPQHCTASWLLLLRPCSERSLISTICSTRC